MESWQFLLIGSVAAVGAALAVGTGAALLRYHRTGTFPGDAEVEVTRGRVIGLYVRVVVGLVVAIWGVASLSRAGLL